MEHEARRRQARSISLCPSGSHKGRANRDAGALVLERRACLRPLRVELDLSERAQLIMTYTDLSQKGSPEPTPPRPATPRPAPVPSRPARGVAAVCLVLVVHQRTHVGEPWPRSQRRNVVRVRHVEQPEREQNLQRRGPAAARTQPGPGTAAAARRGAPQP